jgi:hypothetical protein
MHPDITKAIELIDRRIEGLQRAKQELLNAFGDERVSAVNGNRPSSQSVPPQKPAQSFIKKPKTQKDKLIEFLEKEGPHTRGEIVKKTGIPEGTVAALLSEKRGFENHDHKWSVKAAERYRMPLPFPSGELSSAQEAETP